MRKVCKYSLNRFHSLMGFQECQEIIWLIHIFGILALYSTAFLLYLESIFLMFQELFIPMFHFPLSASFHFLLLQFSMRFMINSSLLLQIFSHFYHQLPPQRIAMQVHPNHSWGILWRCTQHLLTILLQVLHLKCSRQAQ